MNTKRKLPAITWGAALLAVLSLLWSGYAITDFMHSGPFGLSVAIAGDIGWVTVLWAEYRHIALAGRGWTAPAAGWAIALAVAALLVLHGLDTESTAQAVAGPFVVLTGKIVWTFALAAMRDPAALTPEQENEINTVIRDSEYTARLHHARSDAEIARIRAEARTVLARDDADFQITLERIDKRAEIHRRSPLAMTIEQPPQNTTPIVAANSEQDREQIANVSASTPNTVREQIANRAVTSTNNVREHDREPANVSPLKTEQSSIADLVREQIANTTDNATAVRRVLALRPDANEKSVAAAVRRARRQMEGGYL